MKEIWECNVCFLPCRIEIEYSDGSTKHVHISDLQADGGIKEIDEATELVNTKG